MAQLRALSQRRNLRPLLHVLGFVALLTATGALVVLTHRHLSWPWLIPALFLHGTVFRTLQHSRHELSHRTVFRSRERRCPAPLRCSWPPISQGCAGVAD